MATFNATVNIPAKTVTLPASPAQVNVDQAINSVTVNSPETSVSVVIPQQTMNVAIPIPPITIPLSPPSVNVTVPESVITVDASTANITATIFPSFLEPGATAEQVQAALDLHRYVKLLPGNYTFDRPITVTFDRQLEGCGRATYIRYTGTGNYAVLFGPATGNFYDASVRNLLIDGGGIHVRQLNNSTCLENLFIYNAPQDGIYIDGGGEKTLISHVKVWGCGRHGVNFVAYGPRANNGVTIRDLTATSNKGYGLQVQTLDANSSIDFLTVADSIIQGNCADTTGKYKYEVRLAGYVNQAIFDRVYCENPRAWVLANIRLEAKNFSGTVRRVNRPSFDDCQLFLKDPFHFADAYRPAVNKISYSGGKIRWNGWGDPNAPEDPARPWKGKLHNVIIADILQDNAMAVTTPD